MIAARKPLEPWQEDAVRLMMAVRDDGLWACSDYAEWVSRQNGKGPIAEARVLTGLLVLNEPLIMWSAHEVKTSIQAFRRIRALLRSLGTQVSENVIEIDGCQIKITNTNGMQGFERKDNEHQLLFIARSKGSGRGFTGDVNVIDESYAYTASHQDALMPTGLAVPNAQFVYLSTPPLDGETGEVMFSLRQRALKGGDSTLGYRDWGNEGDLDHLAGVKMDDEALWARSNPALGRGRVTLASIRKLRNSMTDKGFAREVLGLWPRLIEGGGAINLGHWAALLDSESRRDGAVALGVDITPAQDYAAIVLYGHRADGLGHVQLVDYRPGTDWIVPRIRELSDALSPMAICAGRGTYATLKTALAEDGFRLPRAADVGATGDVVTVAGADMTAATGQILEAVRQGSFRHVGRRELDAAIAGAVTRQIGDSVAWSRKDAASDITPLVAFTLAKWIYEVRAPLLNYDVLQSVF